MTKTAITVLAITFGFGGVATAQPGLEKKPGGMPPGQAKKEAKEAAAAPAAGAPMAMPKPAPEWEAFIKGLDANWKCETTMPAGSMGPGSPEMKMPTTAKVKKDLGGFVLVGSYEAKKTKTMPGMKGTFTMGSPDGKTLVNTFMDNMGGTSFTSGPLGPDGGTTTGEGFMMGAKVKVRETVQKKGEKEMFHKVEMDMGKGFVPAGEDTCKK
jgi:uncharacterized protein DUF1579